MHSRLRGISGVWFVVLGLGAGCSSTAGAPAANPTESAGKTRIELHVLATAHEAEHLVPTPEDAGGAARMLGYWREHEYECSPRVACATLPVSAGDHWSEGSLASQFRGEPVGEALAQMGYVASAVGRSDLAFGRAVFERNVQRSRVPHVAEGWAHGSAPQGVKIEPSVRLQREGLELEILGLSSTSPTAGDSEKLFKYLNDWAQSLQHRGVDAGVVVSDRCLSELRPAVERGGRTWPYLLLVIGQACGESQVPSPIYSIAMLPAGEGLTSYGRAKLTFDRGSHALLQATTGSIDITASSPTPDPRLQASLAAWTARHAHSQAPQPSAADTER